MLIYFVLMLCGSLLAKILIQYDNAVPLKL